MYINATSTTDGEKEDTEMYITDESIYISSEGMWMSMSPGSKNAQMMEPFNVIQDEHMEKWLEFSKYFDVADNGGAYILTFAGNNEDYKEVILGAGLAVLDEVLKEHVGNLQVVSGSYEIMVDKETYRIISQRMEYETTSSGEMGEVQEIYKSSSEMSDYNKMEEISVPEEVVDQAQTIGGKAIIP